MVSVEITGIKEFMNKLLNSEAFDSFYLEEAVIATFNTFIIDGHLIKSDTDELPDRPDNFPAGGQMAGQSNGQPSPVFDLEAAPPDRFFADQGRPRAAQHEADPPCRKQLYAPAQK